MIETSASSAAVPLQTRPSYTAGSSRMRCTPASRRVNALNAERFQRAEDDFATRIHQKGKVMTMMQSPREPSPIDEFLKGLGLIALIVLCVLFGILLANLFEFETRTSRAFSAECTYSVPICEPTVTRPVPFAVAMWRQGATIGAVKFFKRPRQQMRATHLQPVAALHSTRARINKQMEVEPIRPTRTVLFPIYDAI